LNEPSISVACHKLAALACDKTVCADQAEPLAGAVNRPRITVLEIYGPIAIAVSEHPSKLRLARSRALMIFMIKTRVHNGFPRAGGAVSPGPLNVFVVTSQRQSSVGSVRVSPRLHKSEEFGIKFSPPNETSFAGSTRRALLGFEWTMRSLITHVRGGLNLPRGR
jgi:hypothetical protein